MTNDACGQCGHDFNAHVLTIEADDPTALMIEVARSGGGDVGTYYCPECDCTGTWAVAGAKTEDEQP